MVLALASLLLAMASLGRCTKYETTQKSSAYLVADRIPKQGETARVNGCWLSKRDRGTASVDGRGVGWDGRAQSRGSWHAQVTIQDESWPGSDQLVNELMTAHNFTMFTCTRHSHIESFSRVCKPQTRLKHGGTRCQMFIGTDLWLALFFGHFKFLPLLQNGFGPSIYMARGQINAWVSFAFLPLRGPWPESLSDNAESSYANSRDGRQTSSWFEVRSQNSKDGSAVRE